MGELEKIAVAKALAAGRQKADGLREEMEALVRRYAAKGMGGGLVDESKKLCVLALSSQGDAITEQFEWVITESLWTSQAEVSHYVGLAREHLQPVLSASEQIMKRATDLTGLQKNLPQYVSELATARDEVWTEVDLSLRGAAATAKRRKLRGAVESVVNWVSSLFGRSK
jgi:hypothetical protein